MQKPTTLIISNNTISITDLWNQHWGIDIIDIKHQVRELLLQRKGKIPTSLTKLNNISNTLPSRIEDTDGNIIFEINSTDFQVKNMNAQVYIWLGNIMSILHTNRYIERDCSNLVFQILWVTKFFTDNKPWNINTETFSIQDISSSSPNFHTGDIVLITNKTEITEEGFTLGAHFALYLWEGYFISKYWSYKKFCIETLDEIKETYPHKHTFLLRQKEGVESVHITRLLKYWVKIKKDSL